MPTTSLRDWLRNYFSNPLTRELAEAAPRALDLGLVAGTIGALLVAPGLAATPLGVVLGGLAINRASSYIDRLRPPDVSYDERRAILREGLEAGDPEVRRVAAAALLTVGPDIAATLPPADRSQFVTAISEGMQSFGGPLARIAPRYTAALINPQADWTAVQAELQSVITSVEMTMTTTDGGVLHGNEQRVEDAAGPVSMHMSASGKDSRVEDNIQHVSGKRRGRS